MKIKYFIILILTISASFSCGKWLDVSPEDTVTQEKLFSNGEGFRNALNGVYNDISHKEMYGQELIFATTDVLAQCYLVGSGGIPTNSRYARFSEYDYTKVENEGIIESIWNRAYNSVANCNNILVNIDNLDPSKFMQGEVEKDLIKGESLALRGFLHFEMLRYFSPAPVKKDSKQWIPYFTKFPAIFEPNQSITDILKLIITDLNNAKDLVSRCDTLNRTTSYALDTNNRFKNTSGGDLFFSLRGFRMNYLAISAILARVYNYQGDHENAKKSAMETIEYSPGGYGTAVKFANKNDVVGDKKMTDDLIFGLSNIKLYEYYERFNDATSAYNTNLVMNYDYATLFDDGGDYRKSELLYSINSVHYRSNRNVMPIKPNHNSLNFVDILPIIRLSELWYIVAEAEAYDGSFDEATIALDIVRKGRNCTLGRLDIKNMDQFRDELIKEVKREFYSEGQIFHYYKKLDIDLIKDMRDESYYFPKVKSENIF